MCMQGGRVIPVGFVWGEDMILTNPELRNLTTVFTLTHTHLYKLDRVSVCLCATFRRVPLSWVVMSHNWSCVFVLRPPLCTS